MGNSTSVDNWLSIRGKRRNSSVKHMRAKYQSGKGQSQGAGRALVRVGRGTTDILIGKEDLSLWDEEELRRGRKRDKHGGWQGRDPIIVARAIHDELVKRTLEKANKLLTENLEAALEILVDIMKDDTVDARERLKAIQMIADRAMGKEPQQIKIGTDEKWRGVIAGAIVSMPEELDDTVGTERDDAVDDDED